MLKADDVKTLGFLVLPGFPMSCLTSAIEPLRAANEIAGRNTFDWLVVGESDAPVVSSAHVSFDPDISLEALDHIDFLFFMSGPNGQFQNPKSAYGKIRRLDRQGLNLGGFSGGVFPLTRSGVMQGYRCSVHWCYQAAYEAEFSETVSVESVITIDRKRYTVSGASGVFDLMLKFIDDALGSEIMTEVACWFQHPLVRGEGVSQKIPTLKSASTADMLPDSVSKSIQLFAEHIEDPILISDVAREVETSTRQLVRSFKRSTGQSPQRYYRMMRLNHARQLVLYSNETMTEVALATGFYAAAPMIRHYTELFGMKPQEERKNINIFRVRDNAAIPST